MDVEAVALRPFQQVNRFASCASMGSDKARKRESSDTTVRVQTQVAPSITQIKLKAFDSA